MQGGEWLEKATEEQYAQKQDETQTESTRRQNTASRQEGAGELLERLLDTEKVDGTSEEERRRQVEIVKAATLREEEWKWAERGEKRKKIEEEQRERLSRVRQGLGGERSGIEDVKEFMDVYGLTSLGVAVGIAVIAGAIFAIMSASR